MNKASDTISIKAKIAGKANATNKHKTIKSDAKKDKNSSSSAGSSKEKKRNEEDPFENLNGKDPVDKILKLNNE